MPVLVFLKLGGSLITDKTEEAFFRRDYMVRLAEEIRLGLAGNSELSLLIGHGSGSFGHFAARRHGTATGVKSPEQWHGFAEVARVARRLNHLVTDVLDEAGLPVWPIQPSASIECCDAEVRYMEVRPLRVALDKGLIPLVHGDVAIDKKRGGTIASTEGIFFYLAPILCPQQILLLGEVSGVLDREDQVIPVITPRTFPEVKTVLGGSRGVDVTGGMATKVRDMLQLVEVLPSLTIRIMSGLEPGLLRKVLIDPTFETGTILRAR